VTQRIFADKNLRIVYSVTLMAVMGVGVIAPALPQMARDLSLTPQAVGMLITAFTVPGVILAPLLGVLADRHGRRRILVPSLFLFAIAGAACALARDFTVLLALRLLQGVGAAVLGSLNVTLIGDLFHGRERAAAMGYNASILSLGTATYPALGGALAEWSWRYPFLLSVLALPVGLLVLFRLSNPEPRQATTLREYLGGVWRNIWRREVLGLFTVSVLTFTLLYGSMLTYFPILLDQDFSLSPALIGVLISVQSVATAVVSSRLGRLSRRFSQRDLIVFAFVLYAISLAIIPLLPDWRGIFFPALLFGAAMGLNIPSLQTLLAGLAPAERRAAFMSINGMVLRLGQTLGPVVMGAMYAGGGLRAPFFGGALLALLTIVLVVGLVSRGGTSQPGSGPDSRSP
jgi:predicted MFS family arabinose efflux permease